ncbi:hypothetical protein [Francisella sp. LA112445]|uniref:hypothetical protein n=1 Tax=Francisella sp. LA112445 TaxID=1395624 RepID=UPI001788B778|nr:hypothetical protein [Francisella sp. LA112445]QIW10372.1 hypothetical protein FIP56_06540 [Francisella sp. LA112445]
MSQEIISVIKYFFENISNFLFLILIFIFLYFMTKDILKSFFYFVKRLIFKLIKCCCNRRLNTRKIPTGVDIILGDWGSGKTHYFENVYKQKYNSFRLEKLSCFSYSREEFIKQLITIKFWNRWLSLNGLLAGYILHSWHKMLPKNMLIFIDDLERLPCNKYMANDFIGIIEELKKDNRVVIACSPQDIKQDIISRYLEKLVDYLPHQITLEKQVKTKAIIGTINSTIKDIDNKKSLKDELEKLINLLSDELESGLYNYHKNFTQLFSKNSSDAINLRNIKKVFSQIYKQGNADKIIKIIVDIVSQDISKDITFDNIKSYYRYLKIKEKIELYLVAYELLFTYPNFSTLVQNCKGDNIDHKRKMERGYFSKKLQSSVKDYSESSALEEYEKELKEKIKSKDISKVVFLFEKMQIKKLEELSFAAIGEFLEEIDSLSTINDNDLLRDLVLGNSIEIEKHFTCEDSSSEVYDFCKRVSLYVIGKEILDKEISFPFTLDHYLSSKIKNSFIYLQRIKDFWIKIGDYFIKKEDSFEQMIEELCNLVDWDSHSSSNYNEVLYSVLRILSLVEFYSEYYDKSISEFLKCKSLDKWKNIFDQNIKERSQFKEYFEYRGSEIYLFELNSEFDDLIKKKINECILPNIEEAYKDFCNRENKSKNHDSWVDFEQSDSSYTNLRDNLIEAFESLFPKEIKSYKKSFIYLKSAP